MTNLIVVLLLLAAIGILMFNAKPRFSDLQAGQVEAYKNLADAYKNKADAFENLSNQQEKLLDAYRERLGIQKEVVNQ